MKQFDLESRDHLLVIIYTENAAVFTDVLMLDVRVCNHQLSFLATIRKVVVPSAHVVERSRHGDFTQPEVEVRSGVA